MSDKDVQRNVRSSGQEGVSTPKQRHFHTIGEKGNIPLGDRHTPQPERERVLSRFRDREDKWRREHETSGKD